MRILWLSHDSNMSGANICLDEFMQIMHDEKAENHLVIPRAGKMKEQAANKVKAIHEVKFYSWNWPIGEDTPLSLRFKRLVRNRKAVHDIEKIIKAVKPDFVVSNTVVTPVAAVAAKRTGTKHIWFVHEFGEEDHGYTIGGGFDSAAKKMNLLSHEMVFVSKAVEKKYAHFVPSAKRKIVYNAFLRPSIEVSKPKLEGPLKLLMLGQIAPSKNQLDAFKAIRVCKDAGMEISLDIFGKADEESYKQMLDDFIIAKNLQEHIHFRGTTSHAEQEIVQHDALLMCSRMEAFGRVTVEALQCGVPVIAANAGGTIDIVIDQHDGYLYESGNVNDLATKIQMFANNRSTFVSSEISTRARTKFNRLVTKEQLLNVFF